MRVGKKRYLLRTCLRRWLSHNFSRYDSQCNRQCCFGVRSPNYKDNKCLNRWHPVKCGECHRASELKLKYPLR